MNLPAKDAQRLITTCDSLSFAVVSCNDKLFCEFKDAKRKIDETNDHNLLPENLGDVIFDDESSGCSFIVSGDRCWLSSSTRRAGIRFFETFGVKI